MILRIMTIEYKTYTNQSLDGGEKFQACLLISSIVLTFATFIYYYNSFLRIFTILCRPCSPSTKLYTTGLPKKT